MKTLKWDDPYLAVRLAAIDFPTDLITRVMEEGDKTAAMYIRTRSGGEFVAVIEP